MTRVRYYGHIGAPTGYAIAGAEMCMAMLDAGIELDIMTTGKRLESEYQALLASIKDEKDAHPEPDTVIVHTLPLDCHKVVERIEESLPASTTYIAYTTWEGRGEPPREIMKALMSFDRVWVPSSASRLPMPGCIIVPHAYDPAAYPPIDAPPRDHQGQPYRFYTIGAWTARKNPEGVIRAYLRAFRRGDSVELVIHSVGAPPYAVELAVLAATGNSQEQEAPIVFSTEELTSAGIHELHRRSDCFVSASHGEAWNMPAFDAMLYRNRIIVPDAHGSYDYLYHTGAWFYQGMNGPAMGDVRLQYDPSGRCAAQFIGGQCLDVRALWSEPNLVDLASRMTEVMHGKQPLRYKDGFDPATQFSRQVVGAKIRRLLEGKDPR